jgi:hypothetical protein
VHTIGQVSSLEPMAAAFARCGYVVVDRLMVHV